MSPTAEMSWTAEQMRAIERRHGDLLLDAGAGSGKTSVLVERFVAAVREDGIDVSAILTITFTEKAAAELRDRIRSRLRELGEAEAARATEGAFISTIDGFCARVLRANALAAGIDPRFTVLDRGDSEPLGALAFDDALDELAKSSERAVDLIAAYGPGPLRAAILGTYAQLRSGGQSAPRLPACPQPTGLAAAAAALGRAADAVAAELAALTNPSARVADALARAQRCRELIATADLWPGELESVRLPGGNGAALTTEACADYAEALAGFRALCAARAAGPVRDLLDGLLAGFATRYAQHKRDRSGIDFEDLELITRDLLLSSSEIRERYRTRFARIMVDELQDTNPVQLELIEAIADQNLFTVGDAQQAIYGFRHADVALFEARGERLAAAGARETLQTNFRSRPEILTVLNQAFAGELGPRFKALVPSRRDDPGLGRRDDPGLGRGDDPGLGRGDDAGLGRGDDPGLGRDHDHGLRRPDDSHPAPRVELLVIDKGAEWTPDGLASPWRLAEARALAERVGELIEGGAQPREIVVLIRATTDMRAYERALERRGIPTYVIGGRGYWSHPQVVDLVGYLRALANPREEEALYTVLASPLVGASLDALVILGAAARASARDPWWVVREPGDQLSDLDPSDRRKLDHFACWFADERLAAARVSIEELIDRALVRTQYDLAMLALPGGERRLANVRKLMRLGRDHEAAHGHDLRGFVELIRDREAGGSPDSRESEAPVEGEGLDAVRLMTIHRAKGLEFEIVCVADLGRSPWRPAELLRVSADGRLGLRLARPGTGGREPALGYKQIGDEQLRAQESEERRLFYVAMTRAKERLIISGAAKLDGWTEGGAVGGGAIAWIAPALIPDLADAARAGTGTTAAGVGFKFVRPEDEPADEPEPGSSPRSTWDDTLSDSCKSPNRSPEPPAIACAPALVPPTPPGIAPPTVAPQPAPAPRALAPQPAPAPFTEPPVTTVSYSSLGEYARCGYRFYAQRLLGLPELPYGHGAPVLAGAGPAEPVPGDGAALRAGVRPELVPGDGGWTGERSAAERGVLIHSLLERLDFRRPLTPRPEAIADAARCAGLAPLSRQEAAALAALVAGFAATDLCARIARATDASREQRFAFPLAGDVLVTGALDVLVREPGGRALVVDYKSDRLQDADPADVVDSAYSTQQLVYAIALLRSGAQAVEIAHCFLERPDSPVMAAFSQSDLPALEQRLAALTSGVLERRFAVADAPHRALCRGCPAEGGLCSWPLAMTRRESPDRLF
jgi:ATP-dependent helicase/nuclease subunit A